MTKKADTWMPWYVGDYLAGTMLLNTEQHGAYCLLLMACFKEGGSLPADDETLASITKLPLSTWRKYREKLLAFFIIEDGVLHHKRVSYEVDKARALVAQKSEAGKQGAARRWQKDGKQDGGKDGTRIADAISPPMAHPSNNGWRNDAPSQSQLQKPRNSVQDLGSSARERPAGVNCTPAEACKAMRDAGIQRASPSHPELLALCEAGATIAEFTQAATDAKQKNKPFGYAVAIVKGRREDAARAAAKTAKNPRRKSDHASHAAVEPA